MEKIVMAVILTALSDDPSRPSPQGQDFEHLFFKTSPGGQSIADYYRAVSYSTLDFSGSRVFGWVQGLKADGTPMDTRDYLSYPGGGDPQRMERIFAGIRGALQNGIDLSPFNVIVTFCNHVPGDSFGVANHPVPALGRSVGLALIDPGGWGTSIACHEIGHAMGLSHSFGPYAAPESHGEYGDPWDLMSVQRAFMYSTGNPTNGNAGPWLCAPNLRLKDWVPQDRIAYLGIDFATLNNRTVTLAALNHPEAAGPLVLELLPPLWPYAGSTYMVEFRRKDGFDARLPRDVVLVHELPYSSSNARFLSTSKYLVPREQDGMVVGSGSWRLPAVGLDLVVEGIDTNANVATVRFSAVDIAVNTTDELRVVDRQFAGIGEYNWPGDFVGKDPEGRCSAKTYEFTRLMLTQRAIVSAHPTGMSAARPLAWTINDQPVSGVGVLPIQVRWPAPKTVSAYYEISANTLTLQNDPADGKWATWVTCMPADPLEPGKGDVSLFTFEPEMRWFSQQYYQDMEYCAERRHEYFVGLQERVAHLAERQPPTPPGGDPPWRWLQRIEEIGAVPEGMSIREIGILLELRELGKTHGQVPQETFARLERPSVVPAPIRRDTGSPHG